MQRTFFPAPGAEIGIRPFRHRRQAVNDQLARAGFEFRHAGAKC